MKTAVCLLAPQTNPTQAADLEETRFLSVSRRNDTSLWGFPGGKLDLGETTEQALVREVREEVGLRLKPEYLVPLYSAAVPGKTHDDTFWVITYLRVQSAGNLQRIFTLEGGLTLGWRTPAELSDPKSSPFAAYNQEVFKAYRAWLGFGA